MATRPKKLTSVPSLKRELEDLQRRVERQEYELRLSRESIQRLKQELHRTPHWTRLTGDKIPIADMDDIHLVNSLKCVLRLDPRYGCLTVQRLRELFYLILEAKHRKLIDTSLLEYVSNLESCAGMPGPTY